MVRARCQEEREDSNGCHKRIHLFEDSAVRTLRPIAAPRVTGWARTLALVSVPITGGQGLRAPRRRMAPRGGRGAELAARGGDASPQRAARFPVAGAFDPFVRGDALPAVSLVAVFFAGAFFVAGFFAATFSATAARMSALSALASIVSPSWTSIARRTLPSRLELNSPRVLERRALGERHLDDALVGLAGADDAVVRPHRHAAPFPLLDDVGIGLLDQRADPRRASRRASRRVPSILFVMSAEAAGPDSMDARYRIPVREGKRSRWRRGARAFGAPRPSAHCLRSSMRCTSPRSTKAA